MRRGVFSLFFLFSILHAEVYTPKSSQEKIELFSEYTGYMFGRELQLMNFPYDVEALVRGFKAYKNGLLQNDLRVNDEIFELILSIQEDLFEKKAEENRVLVEEFFNNIDKKLLVVRVIDRQLYYETITEGAGSEIVQQTSEPLVRYSVHTLDGVEITNTFEYANPIPIPLNEAILGFVKGVIGMKQGERRKLYVHPDLAYHRGGNVPPNSLLIFDVEIVSVNSSKS